jgi:hypothetical protein
MSLEIDSTPPDRWALEVGLDKIPCFHGFFMRLEVRSRDLGETVD